MDGNINDVKNIFSISQHRRDKYLLNSLLTEMKSNNPLRLNHNNYSFEIRSKEIVSDIIRLGGIPRKSLTVKFPSIPKKYLPDFIRGLWDGDGSISYIKNLNHYTSSFSCGSKKFIYKMLCVLKKNIKGLSGNIYVDHRKMGKSMPFNKTLRKDSITYSLHMGVNDTRRLRNFIYKDNPKLKMKRKYDKFMSAGEINIACKDREYLGFESARKYIRNLKLLGVSGWKKYCKSGNKPNNIPSNIWQTYKNKGFIGFEDFLG